MAATHLDSWSLGLNSSFVTPSANTLVLAWVTTYHAGGSPPTPTMSGCGLTWKSTPEDTVLIGTDIRLTLLSGIGPSPSNGQLTIGGTGGSTNVAASVSEYPLAGRVAQTATDTGTGSAAPTLSDDIGGSNTAAVGIHDTTNGVIYTYESGWTQLGRANTGTIGTLASAYNTTQDESATLTGASTCGAIIAEVAPALKVIDSLPASFITTIDGLPASFT